MVNYCEDTGKFFTITGEKRESVRENIGNIPAGEWKPLYDKDGIKTDREVAEYVEDPDGRGGAESLRAGLLCDEGCDPGIGRDEGERF